VRRWVAVGLLLVGCSGDRAPAARETPSFPARTLAVGATFSCALRDRQVWCWGAVPSGQAADPVVPVEPRRIPALDGATEIVAGAGSLCALLDGGRVMCWGAVFPPSSRGRVEPREVPQLSPAKHIAIGDDERVCAVKDARWVRCHPGTRHGRPWTEVFELPDVRELVGSGSRTCARLGDGTARCWRRGHGETNAPEPLRVTGVRALSAAPLCVSTASATLCEATSTEHVSIFEWMRPTPAVPELSPVANTPYGALFADGSAVVLGRRDDGSLETAWPRGGGRTPAPEQADELAWSPRGHLCWTQGGRVRCRGRNVFGEAGRPADRHGGPHRVLGDAVHLAVGPTFACAVGRDGAVRCWGQLSLDGDDTGDLRAPIPLEGFPPATHVAIRGDEILARAHDGRLWRSERAIERFGSPENPTEYGPRLPPTPLDLTADALDVAAIDPNGWSVVCLRTGRRFSCAGPGGAFEPLPGLAGVGRIVTTGGSPCGERGSSVVCAEGRSERLPPGARAVWGSRAKCLFDGHGTLRCEGANDYGRLGLPPRGRIDSPTEVSALAGAIDGFLGTYAGCFWDASGPLRCAGYREDLYPYVYDPAFRDADAEARAERWGVRTLSTVRGVKSVVLLPRVGCALTHEGEVSCWGDDAFGHAGRPERSLVSEPVAIDLP
jgi:hypothetical protein